MLVIMLCSCSCSYTFYLDVYDAGPTVTCISWCDVTHGYVRFACDVVFYVLHVLYSTVNHAHHPPRKHPMVPRSRPSRETTSTDSKPPQTRANMIHHGLSPHTSIQHVPSTIFAHSSRVVMRSVNARWMQHGCAYVLVQVSMLRMSACSRILDVCCVGFASLSSLGSRWCRRSVETHQVPGDCQLHHRFAHIHGCCW